MVVSSLSLLLFLLLFLLLLSQEVRQRWAKNCEGGTRVSGVWEHDIIMSRNVHGALGRWVLLWTLHRGVRPGSGRPSHFPKVTQPRQSQGSDPKAPGSRAPGLEEDGVGGSWGDQASEEAGEVGQVADLFPSRGHLRQPAPVPDTSDCQTPTVASPRVIH